MTKKAKGRKTTKMKKRIYSENQEGKKFRRLHPSQICLLLLLPIQFFGIPQCPMPRDARL